MRKIEPLGIDHVEFHIRKQIETAPSGMMIRELAKNAIEATATSPIHRRQIHVFALEYEGTPKLSIFNTGTGMNATELANMGNLACKSNKIHALDQNFGEGAKVASLRYNSLGMVYRSCKNGSVFEMTLGKLGDDYGRLVYDNNRSVVNITGDYKQHELKHDWTQVILLGQSADQNTVVNPYGDVKLPQSWLAEELYHRFYRLDPSIEIFLEVGHRAKNATVKFETIEHRRFRPCDAQKGSQIGVFSHSDTVNLKNGMKIHFIHDEKYHNNNISITRNSHQTDMTFGGVIYKNELYSLYKGGDWTGRAFKLGINFGAKHISVMVELPDNYPLVPSAHRKSLLDLNRNDIILEQFGELVIENRPQWLIDLIASYASQSKLSLDDVEKKLRELMNELDLQAETKQAAKDASDATFEDGLGINVVAIHGEGGGGEGGSKASTKKRSKDGPDMAQTRISKYPMFEIIPLNVKDEVIEKNLVNKAALFVMNNSGGTLFINMLYPAVADLLAKLTPLYRVDHLFATRATDLISKAMIIRVGSTVVRALSKRKFSEWSNEDVERALSAESLSMAADDDAADVGQIKSRLSSEFVTEKMAA